MVLKYSERRPLVQAKVVAVAQKRIVAEISAIRSANCRKNAEAHYDAIWTFLDAAQKLGVRYEGLESGQCRERLDATVRPLLVLGMLQEAGDAVESELAVICAK